MTDRFAHTTLAMGSFGVPESVIRYMASLRNLEDIAPDVLVLVEFAEAFINNEQSRAQAIGFLLDLQVKGKIKNLQFYGEMIHFLHPNLFDDVLIGIRIYMTDRSLGQVDRVIGPAPLVNRLSTLEQCLRALLLLEPIQDGTEKSAANT